MKYTVTVELTKDQMLRLPEFLGKEKQEEKQEETIEILFDKLIHKLESIGINPKITQFDNLNDDPLCVQKIVTNYNFKMGNKLITLIIK